MDQKLTTGLLAGATVAGVLSVGVLVLFCAGSFGVRKERKVERQEPAVRAASRTADDQKPSFPTKTPDRPSIPPTERAQNLPRRQFELAILDAPPSAVKPAELNEKPIEVPGDLVNTPSLLGYETRRIQGFTMFLSTQAGVARRRCAYSRRARSRRASYRSWSCGSV